MMLRFEVQDRAAGTVGAVSYYDDMITSRANGHTSFHFARYYFNVEGDEVAYFIPNLLPFKDADHLVIHPQPRIWPNHLDQRALVRVALKGDDDAQ